MSRYDKDTLLSDWRQRALSFQQEIGNAVIGLDHAIRQITLAIFSRGHVMLEGDVGVGKTTLEGTIDLMPNDLIYHTYINEVGRPQVDPGPILKNGEQLSVFFFNEVNRARPQVHSLLLRVMAERSITAFNREYFFPHLLVFADRNRVEKEETFEIPSAARDRFLMELHIETPQDPAMQRALMFDPRFHDTDRLIEDVQPGVLPYRDIADIARVIQVEIKASDALQQYALDLWQATRRPQDYGIKMDGVDMRQLVLAGASPRGMSMMMRAARVSAWLNDRTSLIPEDIRQVFVDTTAHRVFFNPVYELRRSDLVGELMSGILQRVAAP